VVGYGQRGSVVILDFLTALSRKDVVHCRLAPVYLAGERCGGLGLSAIEDVEAV
jgi:hypothetical protein